MVLTDLPYSTRSAWGQASSAHHMFRKENTEDTVSFMSKLMASEARERIFWSSLVLSHWNKSLRPQTEMLKDVEIDNSKRKNGFCMSLK